MPALLLSVTATTVVGVVFLLAMTFLVIRLFRAVDRMDEVDPNEPRGFVERLIEAWGGGSAPNEVGRPPNSDK